MTISVSIQESADAFTEYTVRHQDGCVLVFGPVPLSVARHLAAMAGDDSVMSPQLADFSGANFAMGSQAAVDALIEKLAPSVMERLQRNLSGTGLSQQAIAWLANGERGISSNTILSHLTGFDALNGSAPSVPLDPSDVRRCRLLLAQCHELAEQFDRMREVDGWAPFVDAWPEICAQMDEETPTWRNPVNHPAAPKTYALIKRARGEKA